MANGSLAAPLTSRPISREAPGRALVNRSVAAALAVAGGIHLVLIPQHFAESLLFGAVFVAIAGFQLWLAAAFLRGPGARAHRAALLGTLAILIVWAGTRFVAPPTGSGPEEVDAWGVIAAGVELAAVVLLASTIPATSKPRRRGTWAAAGALGFALLYLIASGSAGTGPSNPSGPLVEADPLTGDFSLLVPGVVLLLDGGRVFVTLPWTTGVFLPIACGLLAAQIYMALDIPACEVRLAARRRGAFSLMPALFAAPVCCGLPLVSFLGTGAIVALVSVTPWLLIATCLLLGATTWQAWRARRLLRDRGEPA